MRSAFSQQVQTIQEALKSWKENEKEGSLVIRLAGKQVKVSPNMAVLFTPNPGYAGRSNLPENLKKKLPFSNYDYT
jgi:dynein heavy chain 1